MSEFFQVTHGTQPARYVEADDKKAARKLALTDMKIIKLKGGEVAKLLAAGHPIIRADAGSAPAGE